MELSKVWGIGYRKAQTLIDKYNIWSVAELKIKVEENPKLVEARVHRTLRCHDDLQLRMSREEALETPLYAIDAPRRTKTHHIRI